MNIRSGLIILLSLIALPSFAQMNDDGITKYGNEWIVPGRDYYKIRVSKDGFYKIDFNALKAAGMNGEIVGSRLQLFRNGVEIPIAVSANGQWSGSDFLTFNGYYNKSEMDKYSFPNGVNDIVNPKASMYSDTATYFLTVNPDGNNLRTNILDNNLVNPPTPEPYIIRISEMDFREILNTKTEYAGQHPFLNTPFYPGKGMVTSKDNQTYNLACPGLLPDSRLPIFRYRGITNAGNVGLNLGHDLKFSMKGQPMYSVFSTGQRVIYVNFEYVDSNRVITASDNQYSLTNGHPLDLIKTGYAAIEYPSDLNIDATKNQSFYLEGKTSDRLLEFNASGNIPTAPYLTDSLGTWKIPGEVAGNTIRFRIPAFSATSRFIYRPGDDAETIASMTKVEMKDYNNLNADYIILSHGLLLDDANGLSAVEQYANYRESAAGGGYHVEVINVSDLYNSFGYGLDYNPMAIKNFANYIGLKGSTRFLFIIGRGRDYKDLRLPGELTDAIAKGYGVPTFGDYGSDNLLVSKSFHKIDMNMAVGRLPATSQDEVLTYLNKIRTSDAAYNAPGDNDSRQWTKTIVQLNGGNVGQSDQAAIAAAQSETEKIIKTSKIAGFVETFVKGSNETIGKASDDFFKLVNQGVSIVDYFGHGARNTLEYPVDIPSKYNNSPRLPILIIKGCKTGNCQIDGSSMPTRVLYEGSYKNSGYRAVIGSISDSDLYSLSSLARQFYTYWGNDYYDKSLGELFRLTFNAPGLNTSSESIQQLYAGDPALRIMPFPGPDFTIRPNDVTTSPESITSTDSKFSVEFKIKNLGTFVKDTLFYTASYENGDKKIVETKTDYIVNPASENNVTVEFDIDKTNSTGENTIYLTLDPDNKIQESVAPQAESNNEYFNPSGRKGFKFFIQSSLFQQVYPYRFAIIDTNEVTLSAFSQTLYAGPANYHWSIDTTDTFNSPSLRTFTAQQESGHLEWQPGIRLSENTVYFWRVSRDSLSAGEPAISSVSSFIYLPGKTGFSQSHNGQYREDELANLKVVGGGNNIQFGTRKMIYWYINGLVDSDKDKLGIFREGDHIGAGLVYLAHQTSPTGLIGTFWYRKDSMFVHYPTNTNPYGAIPSPNANNRNYLMFNPLDSNSRRAFINFIENVVGDEDIITAFTYMNNKDSDLGLTQWAGDSTTIDKRNIFNVLEKYGAKQVRNMEDIGPRPYTFMFTKKEGILNESLSEDYNVISNEVTTQCHSDYGTINQIFGPVSKWDSFELLPKDSIGRNDTVTIVLTAIHRTNPDSNYEIIKQKSLSKDLISFDLQQINAEEYPYIKLSLQSRDPFIYRGKMDGWKFFRFIASELPEATLLYNTAVISKDTLNQGEILDVSINSMNIGRISMDSMLVKFSLQKSNSNSLTLTNRFGKLPLNKTDKYDIKFDTKPISGNYSLIVEMNPNEDQPEGYHGNNIYRKDIYIQGDRENPLVDVTFDGQHIFNGDIVSSKPFIKIMITDENKLFALDDPDLFNVFLVNAFGQDTLIPFNSPDMKFIPADLTKLDRKNEATIEFTPVFANYPQDFNEDGEYSIRITAKDKAGNQSGKYDFEKRFKIINKKSVSNLFNYPNPFSNATRFVFTLTGSEPPSFYGIQIMTVSGKVVREINQDELGPLKIGKHMTDYVWDGRDQYGDKLANGVYLYRFIVKDQEKKDYEKLMDGKNTNHFFTGEWGKLVIIR